MTTTMMLILNGKAASNADVRDAVVAVREAGHRVDVRLTWEGGDAARYVDEACRLGLVTVVAGGGDGTVNEVAVALLQLPAPQRPSLAVLPLGTANDFARGCAIPIEPGAALALALQLPTPIDAVRVNDRGFINMATGGFGTQITVETPPEQKALLGGFAYLLTGLTRFGSLSADASRLSGPDFDWEGEFLVLGLGNGAQSGGGHRLCPDAKLDDGLLDLRLVTGTELLPALLQQWIDGENSERVLTARLPWLTVSTPHEINLNLDGEPMSGTEFRIEVEPGALRCHLPSGCPLLLGTA
ncbi:lipid kinase YegS [Jeongeupia naejangsanensis]|uniref:Lipid kinase YegS n=1 Tax=Jeongeupia naejangsanensis TaxID=613195 RepID=A0ABS2BI72_9NEIS|nr:lipid kinase YegS [Jeongeupia naejangsanensis]MBM3115299.1 lipid kinase YegS [Jeongeupia naejangsanensis]